MKSIKGFTMGLVLGLALALSGIALAQDATQNDPNKKPESCCAMTSCCCKADSCSMKNGSSDKGNTASNKKEGGCCCCGDSCDMKGMKEKPKQSQ